MGRIRHIAALHVSRRICRSSGGNAKGPPVIPAGPYVGAMAGGGVGSLRQQERSCGASVPELRNGSASRLYPRSFKPHHPPITTRNA